MPLLTDERGERSYGVAVSGGMLYAVIVLAAWPGFAYLLHRLGRPTALWQQLIAGALMAAFWPLTVSFGVFGGVAVARLIRISANKSGSRPKRRRRRVFSNS